MRSRFDVWLGALLGASLLLCIDHLEWGLPHGNESWAADAMGPLTVLNVGRRQLAEFNSGWFWFKYPFGYPLLLLAAYTPYLGYLWLSGGLRNPTRVYPYGLEDPETTLYHLALLGRLVNVVAIVGTVVLTYDIGRRLLGRRAGLIGAWLVATAYPLVYYAHTTNQDAAYLFWLTLSLWAAVVVVTSAASWAYLALGAAAGMAMATKEQGFALLLGLAIVLVVHGLENQEAHLAPPKRLWRATFHRGTLSGLGVALAVWLVAGNALLNPAGFLNRLRDLTGNPVAGLSSRVTPVEFSWFKGWPKEWQYLSETFDVLASTFGLPVFLAGAVGAVYLTRRRPRAALCLLVPAVAYYLISLRTHHVLTLRYTLPLMPILAITAAALLLRLVQSGRRAAFLAVALLLALAGARAVEMNLLLRWDPRYDAEAWMAENLPRDSHVETYQKPVYLPRFAGLDAKLVPLQERSVEAVLQRRPDVIVLSSASHKTIHHFWTADWRQGDGSLLTEVPAATEMLRALESGELPYREEARFARSPVFLAMRITSVAPQIRIFRRVS